MNKYKTTVLAKKILAILEASVDTEVCKLIIKDRDITLYCIDKIIQYYEAMRGGQVEI